MQKYQDVVLNQNGNPIAGAQITVTDLLGTPVAVYSSNAIGLDVNPLTSGTDGHFSFYAPDGRYSLVVRFGGNIVSSVTDILLEDPLDGSDAVFTDVTVLGSLSDASKVSSAPTGNVAATNVQDAIAELDSEKASVAQIAQKVDSADLAASGGAALVGFKQPGAGAVDTDVEAKLQEIISTAGYTLFSDAVTAAAGKTLIVNTPVTVSTSLTIPDGTIVIVQKPGQITTNAGQTLTISGQFEAGAFQVFYGTGSVVFTSSSKSISPKIWFGTTGAVFNTARSLVQNATDPGGPVHAFEDDNTLNFTYPQAANFNAYAGYDCKTQITGSGAYDHHVSFQARPTYTGSGSIWSRWDGFNWLITHTGIGTVATARGVHIENPLGSGPITTLAGVYVERLNRGSTNYGIYSATERNVVSTNPGEAASWLLRGNGQTGGFGFLLQSRGNSNGLILNTADAPTEIGNNNVVHSIITSNGRWKIGTTTDLVSAFPALDVTGNNGIVSKPTGTGSACILNWSAHSTGDNIFQGFYTEATITQRGSIDYNRAAGQVRYNTTSDATLKNLIGDASHQASVSILESTRLREYSWKDDPVGKTQIGVIAQELHQTFPGAVSVGGDYQDEVDGETVTKYKPWAVDKTAFTFHLIAGFQYQQEKIAALELQIADLAKRVSAIEQK